MRTVIRTLLVVSLVMSGCRQADANAEVASADPVTLDGAWRLAEVTTTGPNASTNSSPQPGLLLIVDGHYTSLSVNGTEPRPLLPESGATIAQRYASLQAMTAQAGTYEVAANRITRRPQVAKNPSVMAPGSFTTTTYNLSGDTLTIVGLENQDGPIVNPSTNKYVRAAAPTAPGPLDGAWRVVEITTTGPEGRTNSAPEPGIRLYVDGYYSLLQLNRTRGPQPDSTASEEDWVEVWSALQANAGPASVEGDRVTSKGAVAMSPAVMVPDRGPAVRTYRLAGDTLWLTQVSNFAGPIANPLTEKLVRIR